MDELVRFTDGFELAPVETELAGSTVTPDESKPFSCSELGGRMLERSDVIVNSAVILERFLLSPAGLTAQVLRLGMRILLRALRELRGRSLGLILPFMERLGVLRDFLLVVTNLL